jgi:hypothetical protein
MRQRAGDLVLGKVCGARRDVVAMGLQPLELLGGYPVAEDVDRLRLALEVRRQLHRDEGVGQVVDLQGAVDRVVVGDRHKVHPGLLGQLVHLGRLGRALGQRQRALDPELRARRRRRVHVHVGPAVLLIAHA